MQRLKKANTRRQLFHDCGIGIGKVALASLFLQQNAKGRDRQSVIGDLQQHPAPHAKRVIYLFMAGAPSQLDLFDYKPKLVELEGKPIPPSVIDGQRYAFIQPDAAVLAPRFPFRRHGESGLEISDALPKLGSVADQIALIRTVHTDQFNHSPAQLFINTGSGIPGRPSMGSWLSYGLGNEATDLPAFVVLKSGGSLSGGSAMWSSGFLPGEHQGVPFRGTGEPILHVKTPDNISEKSQIRSIDFINAMNQKRLDTLGLDSIQTRIESYEMAYRMQSRAPELMDLNQEDQRTLESYGITENDKGSFAKNCLLARRLAERGVRFIQVYHSGWDHHSNVQQGLKRQCEQTDQACAALLQDLKRRGMLEDTLVVWGGEFGRTPMVEASAALGRKQGRDHHPQAFSMWLAGGGIKTGQSIGKTDDLGFHPIEDAVHVHDVQATILHQLGINHERLTFHHAGRDFRLTDVHGNVIEKLIS
ncbi:DUF1501 domain-containing protein [bacterium]|nr:DUF1501 domain-containing protein [bacterium]